MDYARDNHFGPELSLQVGELDQGHPVLDRPWNVVMANLDERSLSGMTESLGQIGRQGGTILVSGLLTNQTAALRHIFARFDLYVVQQREREEWVALRLQSAQSCDGALSAEA